MSIEGEVTVNSDTIKLLATPELRRLLALVEDEMEERRALNAGTDPDELDDDDIDDLADDLDEVEEE